MSGARTAAICHRRRAVSSRVAGRNRAGNSLPTTGVVGACGGVNDCVARGFQRTGFYEVDTGSQENWTIQLTEPTSRGVGGR